MPILYTDDFDSIIYQTLVERCWNGLASHTHNPSSIGTWYTRTHQL